MEETKLTEPEKASIYGKFARIKEERTKPVGYHLIGDMVSDAQDAKTKRVMVEWLEKKDHKEGFKTMFYLCIPREKFDKFKKWALGE